MGMKRFVEEELIQWKSSPRRKPLVLRGARQVGKTWLVEQFLAKTALIRFFRVLRHCGTKVLLLPPLTRRTQDAGLKTQAKTSGRRS